MPVRSPDETPAPQDNAPLPGEVERERADVSVVSILAVLAVTVGLGLWFFTKDREMIASDGTTVKQTTGTGASDGRNGPSVAAPSAAPGRDSAPEDRRNGPLPSGQ